MRIASAAAASLLALAVLVPSAGASTTQTNDTLFLRGNGCGATEDLYLDTKMGNDEYDGCGTIGGLPVNEALGAEEVIGTRGTGVDYVLDASRNATVTVRAESWLGDGIPGVGESVVDISLRGTKFDGVGSVLIGSGTSTILNTGSDNATHVFDLDLADGLDLQRIKGVTLTLSVRGANVNTNNLGMSGDSFIQLPTLDLTTE